nr:MULTISPECIES: FecR family protein [Myxococcaceae]
MLAALGCRARPASAPDAGTPADAGLASAWLEGLTLEGLTGEVRVLRGDAPGTPALAGPLRDGDLLQTGAAAGATVRLPDGRSVELGPAARLRVQAREGHVELEVLQGEVLSRTPAAAPDARPGGQVELALLTPQGLTRVGAGGEVQVAVRAGDSVRVEVRLGEVEFERPTGERTRARRGEVLEVTAGRLEVVAREPRVVELAPLRVTVRAEGGGGAQLRRRGEAAWRALPSAGEALAAGDALRTGSSPARLALEGSGSSLLLQGRGELAFGGASTGDALDEARVELRRGALALQLAPGRTGRLVLPELTVEGGGADGGGLQLERGAKGLTVAASAGDATLVRGEQRHSLRAGERARVPERAGDALEVEAVPAAPVALPADGAGADGAPLQVFHAGLTEVALTWAAAPPPEGVQVEVASDAAFAHPVLVGRVHAASVNVPVPARGSLYWRVRGADGAPLAQGSAHFAPEPRQRPLAQLRNEVPEGPERTTIFYQDRDKPPAVTFTWEPTPGATRYRLSVYRDGALDSPVTGTLTPLTRAALEAGALGEGRFLWSVAPLSAQGAVLRGGRMNKLELAYDNSVPALMVQAPRNGQRAGTGPVRVLGVAPVGSRVSVNGDPLRLDAKGRFDARVAPRGQPPLLLFMMSRPGAPDSLTVRRLR